MARTNQPRVGKQSNRGQAGVGVVTTKHPVIDNRKYPSTDEVGRILNVPASRVRQLKDLAATKLKAIEVLP